MQGADPANRPSFSWFLLPVSHSSTILTNCSAAEFVCRRNRAVLRQHSMHNVLRLHPRNCQLGSGLAAGSSLSAFDCNRSAATSFFNE